MNGMNDSFYNDQSSELMIFVCLLGFFHAKGKEPFYSMDVMNKLCKNVNSSPLDISTKTPLWSNP